MNEKVKEGIYRLFLLLALVFFVAGGLSELLMGEESFVVIIGDPARIYLESFLIITAAYLGWLSASSR